MGECLDSEVLKSERLLRVGDSLELGGGGGPGGPRVVALGAELA